MTNNREPISGIMTEFAEAMAGDSGINWATDDNNRPIMTGTATGIRLGAKGGMIAAVLGEFIGAATIATHHMTEVGAGGVAVLAVTSFVDGAGDVALFCLGISIIPVATAACMIGAAVGASIGVTVGTLKKTSRALFEAVASRPDNNLKLKAHGVEP